MVDEEIIQKSLPVLRQPASGVPSIIDTPEGLAGAIEAMSSLTTPVAIDTERAQGFRYDGSARLVQIKRPGAGIFLIDSEVLSDLHPLADILDSPWIFHAPGGDLLPLAELGMVPPSLFDTELAARLTGVESFSLRGVCEAVLGVSLDKSHQNEDWSLRPLPTDWLRYAALDVELLPQLREALLARLEALGRLDWAEQEFGYLLTHPNVPKANTWQNLKGVSRAKKPEQLAIVQELWNTREILAKELDIAPSRLLSSAGIIAAALTNPGTRRKMQNIEEFRRPRARAHTDRWWTAIRRAQEVPREERPTLDTHREGPPPARFWKRQAPEAFERLQKVREAVTKVADSLKLAPEIVLEPRVQRILAWDEPRNIEEALVLADARPWQIEQVLPELLAIKG